MLRALLKGSSLVSVAFAVGAFTLAVPRVATGQGFCQAAGNTLCYCDFDYDECVIIGGRVWCPFGCAYTQVERT